MRDPRFQGCERRLGPVTFHDIARADLIAYLAEPSGGSRRVFNVNAHALNLALRDPGFARLLNEADLCFCDGFGVKVLALLFAGGRVRHRVTVPDFIEETFARIAARGGTAFLLGDDPGVAAAYAAQLEGCHPGLIRGWDDGFFHRDAGREAEVIAALWKAAPDFVPVGMGMPRQEQWIAARWPDLPPALYFAAGSTFSWMSGARRRGPRWAVDHGLEWLCRLLTEPGRVWRRYLLGLPEVTLRLAWYRLRELLRGPGSPPPD